VFSTQASKLAKDSEKNAPGASSVQIPDLAHGIDLIPLSRLQKTFKLHGNKLFEKMLTPQEMLYCQSQQNRQFLQRAGARIAAKEAVSKALGIGINGLGYQQGIDWQEVEVVSEQNKPPQLKLTGKALAFSDQMNIQNWRLSISHDGTHIIASVVALILPN
jgi:holo-[acyl-carrier protein] synthase